MNTIRLANNVDSQQRFSMKTSIFICYQKSFYKEDGRVVGSLKERLIGGIAGTSLHSAEGKS